MPPPTAVHPHGAQEETSTRRNFTEEISRKMITVDHEIGEDY